MNWNLCIALCETFTAMNYHMTSLKTSALFLMTVDFWDSIRIPLIK